MNYIGSKHSLLQFLEESIITITGNSSDYVFCDMFAGTGAVGKHFKKLGYQVIANDIQYYSYVLNRHYIGNHNEIDFKGLYDEISELLTAQDKLQSVCDYLNGLDGIEGFVYKNYCPNENCNRQYFSVENGKLCDAIRIKIENWHTSNKITDDEYYCLLSILLESIDKTANTASVYGAYLKQYKRSALKRLNLQPIPVITNSKEHFVFNDDVNKLVNHIEMDILYLDPPYNARQYSSNYHVLETIAGYDNPKLTGKTGMRADSIKSQYCSRTAVKNEFSDLISKAKAKYIFLSYNNEGLLSIEDVKEIMSKRGEYGLFAKKYTRFKADSNRDYKDTKTTEYLHYVIVK